MGWAGINSPLPVRVTTPAADQPRPGERSGYENRKLSDGRHELWVLLVSEKFAVSAVSAPETCPDMLEGSRMRLTLILLYLSASSLKMN